MASQDMRLVGATAAGWVAGAVLMTVVGIAATVVLDSYYDFLSDQIDFLGADQPIIPLLLAVASLLALYGLYKDANLPRQQAREPLEDDEEAKVEWCYPYIMAGLLLIVAAGLAAATAEPLHDPDLPSNWPDWEILGAFWVLHGLALATGVFLIACGTRYVMRPEIRLADPVTDSGAYTTPWGGSETDSSSHSSSTSSDAGSAGSSPSSAIITQ